ncbi:MAG: PilZ domain-containing protein [Candidatus Eisenbacteria bacterium]|uniref:PilZ domain-containing protein n=1 Tax=Eiseniibacteriota bacterium TaxID=2212470 RepID=A0A849SG49_UNCEI|nr:PilZ domain-containing protein [Candidatus Eisenbacteria bacterium]
MELELPDYWKPILEPLRAGDRHEAVKRLRMQVDHDPFALAPRHVLATLLSELGQSNAAQVQYEKLLTASVSRGDVFRAIAAQRRISEIEGGAQSTARLVALQRWFRLLGPQSLTAFGDGPRGGVRPIHFLRLPEDLFAHAAAGMRLERFDLTWRFEGVDRPRQWVVLWGALRWDLRHPDDNATAIAHCREGDVLFPGASNPVGTMLRIAADTPCECLVIEPDLMAELAERDPGVLDSGAATSPEIVHDERAHLPARPRSRGDLDDRRFAPPSPDTDAPRQLHIAPESRAPDEGRDAGEWLEFGEVSLDGTANGSGESNRSHDDMGLPTLDLVSPADMTNGAGEIPRVPRLTRPSTPAADSPGDPTHGAREIELPTPIDPRTSSAGSEGKPSDRRNRRRTGVSYQGTVQLLGLGQATGVRLECEVVNLSTTGVGIKIPRDAVLSLVRILEDETLRLELGPTSGRVELAGRVRWLDSQSSEAVYVGIQFVLLTRDDTAALEGLIARAARKPAPPSIRVPRDPDARAA